MNKLLLGVLLGALLGALDGWTALLYADQYPSLRTDISGIVIGSTAKGLVAGLITGWIAKRYDSMLLSLLVGTGLAFLFAWLVAANTFVTDATGGQHRVYFEILVPGTLVGLIVGYMVQRYGSRSQLRPA